MATIKAVLNTKYQSKDGTYPIVIRIIDGERQKLYPIDFKIHDGFFEDGQVTEDHPEADIINAVIDEKVLEAKRYFASCKINKVPADLDLVFSQIKSHSFTDYLLHRAEQHRKAEQIEMHYKVERYVRELRWCFDKQNIYFSEITQDFLRTFDTWLQSEIPGNTKKESKKKNCANTRSKKFEFLSKYYNNAIYEGKATGKNPFEAYSIKTVPVKKEKLTKEQIQAIENLDVSGFTGLARDLFLFSYYCRGIRFENCILMKKSCISNGRLSFQINKGRKHLSVPIHSKLQAIIDRYSGSNKDTIFGRLDSSEVNTASKKRSKVGSENSAINRELKVVASLAGIPIELSVHHSRHSFAFQLKKNSNNIHIISQALGHSRTQVTETYLQALDDEAIDSEVSKVFD